MNVRKMICAALPCLAMAGAAQFAHAAGNLVTQTELDQLKTGDSVEVITRALGKPENTTRWMDGTSSMVYEISDHNSDQKIVYVNLNKNNVMSGVQILQR